MSAAKTPSIERRLSRFLANQQIVVLPLWTQLIGHCLAFWRDRRLVFVLDATSLDDRATVLYLGLLVHSRLLPASWQVLPVHQKWEQRQWEVVGALMDRVIPSPEPPTARSSPIVDSSAIRWSSCVRSVVGITCFVSPLRIPASLSAGAGRKRGSPASA